MFSMMFYSNVFQHLLDFPLYRLKYNSNNPYNKFNNQNNQNNQNNNNNEEEVEEEEEEGIQNQEIHFEANKRQRYEKFFLSILNESSILEDEYVFEFKEMELLFV